MEVFVGRNYSLLKLLLVLIGVVLRKKLTKMFVFRIGVLLLLAVFLSIRAVPNSPRETGTACSVDKQCKQKLDAIDTLLTPKISMEKWKKARTLLNSLNSLEEFIGLTTNEKDYIMASMFSLKSLKNKGLPSWSSIDVDKTRIYISNPGEFSITQHGYEKPGEFVMPTDIPTLRGGDQLIVDLSSAFYDKDSLPRKSDKLEYHGSIIHYRHAGEGGETTYIDCNQDELYTVTKYIKNSVDTIVGRLMPLKINPIRTIKFHQFRYTDEIKGGVCAIYALHVIESILKVGGYKEEVINMKTVADFVVKIKALQKRVQTMLIAMPYPLLSSIEE